MPLPLSPTGPVKVPLCIMGFVRWSSAGLPSVLVTALVVMLMMPDEQQQVIVVEKKEKKRKEDDPWLLCTTQFSCCHALNYALKKQCIVLCMFTNLS